MMKQLLFFWILAVGMTASAQNIVLRVAEADSGESIPYANISLGGEHLISNSEGYFTVPDGKTQASLTVTHMGFEARTMRVSEAVQQNNTIKLSAVTMELNTVNVSNIKPDAVAIMAAVKRNLNANYARVETSKNTVFMRHMIKLTPKILDFEVTKSTGFSKKDLKSINADVENIMSRLRRKAPSSYADKLFTHYTRPNADGKGRADKMSVIKAARLEEKDDMASMEGILKNFTDIVFKHLDTTKHYRLKSGWIGSRDTVALTSKPTKNKPKETALTRAKTQLRETLADNNILTSGRFEYIRDQDIYDYTYEGLTLTGDNQFVHIIGFKPRRKKALYTGRVYVSEDDYAVVRSEYQLAPSRKVEGLNLKLLLGIKMAENVSAGTVIYKKNLSGNGYYLQYASMDKGIYFYINRPLKFIELTDAERDVFAFDFKGEGDTFTRTEFLNMARSEMEAAEFDTAAEPQFTYRKMHKYDSEFWKDYSGIEPLQEMKQFSAVP